MTAHQDRVAVELSVAAQSTINGSERYLLVAGVRILRLRPEVSRSGVAVHVVRDAQLNTLAEVC